MYNGREDCICWHCITESMECAYFITCTCWPFRNAICNIVQDVHCNHAGSLEGSHALTHEGHVAV